MNEQPTLIPPEIAATTRSYKRVGVAFGDRFFMLLFVGLVWLGPAFFDSRFVYAMLAWDAFVLVLWLIDLAQMPRPAQLAVKRIWHSPAALSIDSEVGLVLENASRASIRANLIDSVPAQIRTEPPTVSIRARARHEGTASYRIRPMQRGDAKLGPCYVRYQSVFRIAERWARAPLEQTIRIYRDLEDAKRHSMYLLRSRQIALEKRHTRMRGIGREFESLREYQDGTQPDCLDRDRFRPPHASSSGWLQQARQGGELGAQPRTGCAVLRRPRGTDRLRAWYPTAASGCEGKRASAAVDRATRSGAGGRI
ncbi:MAG: hypothetical protein DMG78_11260 [Acidobacteria bacterium]|nr:MAG: hypothetical protein DMG78_11260 [Acidobacteriota bacterium]